MEHIKNVRGILLTRDTYYQVIHDLWRAMPPPVSDRPEDLVCRDNAAMAEVASQLPADPAEAALACQFVAACAHAMDCLRLANEHRAEFAVAMKCRAQAISMMRQACCARSSLLRIQEARRKHAAIGDTSANEPAWSDNGILDRAAEALRRAPTAATEAGPEGATVPGKTEQAVSVRDADPSAASAQTGARDEDLPPRQSVSSSKTESKYRANETPVGLSRPTSPLGDTPDKKPEPHAASRPPQHASARLAAHIERVVERIAPSKRSLPASAAVTAAIHWTPHPAGPTQRARVA